MELEGVICEKLVERLDLENQLPDDFDYDTVLFDLGDGTDSLGLDSIDALELASLLYEEWNLDVPTEDMKKLYSIHAIAEYVRDKQAQNL